MKADKVTLFLCSKRTLNHTKQTHRVCEQSVLALENKSGHLRHKVLSVPYATGTVRFQRHTITAVNRTKTAT